METEAQWHGAANCSSLAWGRAEQLLNTQKLMRVNVLSVVSVIFVGILVGIGAYMPHYRHRSVIRFFFLGATTLFLPIVSYVVSNGSTIASTVSGQQANIFPGLTDGSFEIMFLNCQTTLHLFLILLWVGLAQIIGINTSIIVAADAREGRNNGLPMVLLAQAIWVSYLSLNNFVFYLARMLQSVFALVFAKMIIKYFAFWMARRSLAHGRNPRFIVGYMMHLHERRQHVGPTVEHQVEMTSEQSQEERQQVEKEQETTSEKSQEETKHGGQPVEQQVDTICEQLQEESQQDEQFQLPPPPLIVMGEERQKVEKQPHGYYIRQTPNRDDITMVTIDRIWQLDDTLMRSMPQVKGVCFSFALFKLLRCRFAGYTITEEGFRQAQNFFWYELIKDTGTSNTAERVFRVIEDELSFLHDYYHTSLPMFYSKSYLPSFSILISLLTIAYCLYNGRLMVLLIKSQFIGGLGQVYCSIWCGNPSDIENIEQESMSMAKIGSSYFDIALIFLLLALVVLVEVTDIASYIFSNWTKVALICRYVASHNTRQRPYCINRLVNTVSEEYRCKLTMPCRMMNQCSVLLLHPWYNPVVLYTRLLILLRLPDKSKNINVHKTVKSAIVQALRRGNGIQSIGGAFLPRSQQDGNNFIWDCSDKGTAHTMLICHIATSLLETRHPHPAAPASDGRITATHLSRYCAYLVAHAPELLPDDDKWCKSLYKAVKKNSMDVLANGASRYDDLVTLLSGSDRHEVLRKGAALATKLVSLADEEGSSTAWGVFAVFWSEMILLVTSSSKADNHAEAIARGGELITLLWALLMHAGPAPGPRTVNP